MRPKAQAFFMQYVTEQQVRDAVFETFKGRQRTKPVLAFKGDLEVNIQKVFPSKSPLKANTGFEG